MYSLWRSLKLNRILQLNFGPSSNQMVPYDLYICCKLNSKHLFAYDRPCPLILQKSNISDISEVGLRHLQYGWYKSRVPPVHLEVSLPRLQSMEADLIQIPRREEECSHCQCQVDHLNQEVNN
ncbi:hypothetical protein CBL_10829 [Carabus blaptoides fortunei]